MIYSDSDILLGFAKRDERIFEVIYKRYYQLVYSVCWKICKDSQEAEDRAVCSFTNLFESTAVFPSLEDVKRYLISWAYRKSISFNKKDKRRQKIMNALPSYELDTLNDELDYQYIRAMDIIQKAMSCYPIRGVQVLHMIYFEEKSHMQIAKELGISINTVPNMRKQGLDYLIKRISK